MKKRGTKTPETITPGTQDRGMGEGYDYIVDWVFNREDEGASPTYSIRGSVQALPEGHTGMKEVGCVEAYWMPMAGWHYGADNTERLGQILGATDGTDDGLVDQADGFDDGLVRMARTVTKTLPWTHGWLALSTVHLDEAFRGRLISWHLVGELMEMVCHGPAIVSCEPAPIAPRAPDGWKGEPFAAQVLGTDRGDVTEPTDSEYQHACERLQAHWNKFGFENPVPYIVGEGAHPRTLYHDTELQWPVGSFRAAVENPDVTKAISSVAHLRAGKAKGFSVPWDEGAPLASYPSAISADTRGIIVELFKNGTLTKAVETYEEERKAEMRKVTIEEIEE